MAFFSLFRWPKYHRSQSQFPRVDSRWVILSFCHSLIHVVNNKEFSVMMAIFWMVVSSSLQNENTKSFGAHSWVVTNREKIRFLSSNLFAKNNPSTWSICGIKEKGLKWHVLNSSDSVVTTGTAVTDAVPTDSAATALTAISTTVSSCNHRLGKCFLDSSLCFCLLSVCLSAYRQKEHKKKVNECKKKPQNEYYYLYPFLRLVLKRKFVLW